MSRPTVRRHLTFRGGPLDGTVVPVDARHRVVLDDPDQVRAWVAAAIGDLPDRVSGAERYRWSGRTLAPGPGEELIVMVPDTD